MRTLFLDLASHDCTVAACTGTVVVASRTQPGPVRDHELVPLIESLLQESQWAYDSLTQLACVIGPGGFTSLRVAAAAANVLADQLDIPVGGVHLSDVYRARAEDRELRDEMYWVHSTKRDQLFAHGGQWTEPTLLTVDEFRLALGSRHSTVWMGELIEDHRVTVEALGLTPARLRPLAAVLPAFLADRTYERQLLRPWYGREG